MVITSTQCDLHTMLSQWHKSAACKENEVVLGHQKKKTLTIDLVRRKDAGNSQCEDSNLISSIESAAAIPLLGGNIPYES